MTRIRKLVRFWPCALALLAGILFSNLIPDSAELRLETAEQKIEMMVRAGQQSGTSPTRDQLLQMIRLGGDKYEAAAELGLPEEAGDGMRVMMQAMYYLSELEDITFELHDPHP